MGNSWLDRYQEVETFVLSHLFAHHRMPRWPSTPSLYGYTSPSPRSRQAQLLQLWLVDCQLFAHPWLTLPLTLNPRTKKKPGMHVPPDTESLTLWRRLLTLFKPRKTSSRWLLRNLGRFPCAPMRLTPPMTSPLDQTVRAWCSPFQIYRNDRPLFGYSQPTRARSFSHDPFESAKGPPNCALKSRGNTDTRPWQLNEPGRRTSS